MTMEETANSTVRSAMDQGRQAADKAAQAVKDGYEAAQQFVKDQGADFDLRGFVSRGWQSRPRLRWATSPRRSFGAFPERAP